MYNEIKYIKHNPLKPTVFVNNWTYFMDTQFSSVQKDIKYTDIGQKSARNANVTNKCLYELQLSAFYVDLNKIESIITATTNLKNPFPA